MKILLRIALLSFCAAGGIILAVQLANRRPAAASTDVKPAQDVVAQSANVPAPTARYQPAPPKQEVVRPRTAGEYVNQGPAGFRRPLEGYQVAQAPDLSEAIDARLQQALGGFIQNQTNLPIAP